MFRRSVRALCVVNTAAFKQFRAELADPTEPVAATKARFARLDADHIAALQLRAQARQEQQLAEVAAEAFKPSVVIADHALLIADLEAYRAQLTDDGDGTYAYVASLVKALESPDDGEAIRKTVSLTAWAPMWDADRHGIGLVLKAVDALQPQFKVLSAEMKAALAEVEAAIPTATAKVARKLLQIDFALRLDEASVAFEGLVRCANELAWPSDAANRHGLGLVFKAADALQPQFKVLSAEMKAALVEVEAAIPTTTRYFARNLVQIDFALRRDEASVAFEGLVRCAKEMAWPSDPANRHGLGLVFKAADALQPQFKVLSAEMKAALAEVEAAIPTTTRYFARNLVQIVFALRRDEASVAFEGLVRCANELAWPSDPANRHGLGLVFKAADALQPQFKVLSAEMKAALAEVEAAIPTTTRYFARNLVQIVFALRRDEASVAFEGLVRCANELAWPSDPANRHGLGLVFKAADALQPQLKVLSAEMKAALAEVEAAIPTTTRYFARSLVEIDFALRTDEHALAHRYIRALQERIFTPEEQAQYAPLVKAIEAAVMEKCFAECLSASVDHPDVFDLSKVFFDEPVAGSPCVLCVFSDQPAGPLLPLRAHRTKLRDASQFVVNEEFTKAVNFYVHEYNVDSAIAVYGDRGAGKTMLVTWGPQCPVLYFEGKFPVGCDWAVLESSPHKYCEHRGKYTAALVLLQLAKKLAELAILEAPHTEGELNDACELAKTPKGREKLSAFAQRVVSELSDLKQKRLFERQERIAIVFDEEGADPALARCIRDAQTHIRPLLAEWLNVKHVLVVVSGSGVRLDPVPRFDSRPFYVVRTAAAPKLTFEALLPAADHQRMKKCLAKDPLLQLSYGAALTNARLAVLTAAQVTAAFRAGSTDLQRALRTAMAEHCESNTHLSSASAEIKSDASIYAVAVFLFQRETALLSRLFEHDGTKAMTQSVCTNVGMVSAMRDIDLYPNGVFTLSPAQWLLMFHNYGAGPLGEALTEPSMADVVAATLRAAVCAGATIRQWLVGLKRLLAVDTRVRPDFAERALVEGFNDTLLGASIVTQSSASSLHPVSSAASAIAAVRREVPRDNIVVLAHSTDIIVLFPEGQHVVLHLATAAPTNVDEVNSLYAKMGSLSHATGWHARNLAQIKSRTRAVSKAAKAVENAPAGKKRKQAVVARMTAEKRLKAAKATARESAALVEGLEHDPFSGLGSKRVLYSVIAMPPSDLLAGKVQVALAELESPCMATLLPPSATYPLSVIRRGPEPPARSSS